MNKLLDKFLGIKNPKDCPRCRGNDGFCHYGNEVITISKNKVKRWGFFIVVVLLVLYFI